MSVTVWIPDAPTKTVPCDICEMAREQGEDRCWEHCDGTRQVSVAPEVNWANANARQVFALLGLDADDLCGGLEANEVSNVLQAVNATMARGTERGLARETREERRALRPVEMLDGVVALQSGPRVIECGSPAEHWTLRLEGFREVLSWAARNGVGVSWG